MERNLPECPSCSSQNIKFDISKNSYRCKRCGSIFNPEGKFIVERELIPCPSCKIIDDIIIYYQITKKQYVCYPCEINYSTCPSCSTINKKARSSSNRYRCEDCENDYVASI